MKFDNQMGEKLSESKPNDEQGPYFGRGLFFRGKPMVITYGHYLWSLKFNI